jgi:hypothetical protein
MAFRNGRLVTVWTSWRHSEKGRYAKLRIQGYSKKAQRTMEAERIPLIGSFHSQILPVQLRTTQTDLQEDFIMLLKLAILICWWLPVFVRPASIPALTTQVANISDSHISSIATRQCVKKPDDPNSYDCDMRLPSLKQLVDRLRDTSDEGLVDSKQYIAFYTNLKVKTEEYLGTIIDNWFTYMHDHGDSGSYCYFYDCGGYKCSLSTQSYSE